MKPQTSLLVLLHMFHALFSISETPSIHVLIKQENMKKRRKKETPFISLFSFFLFWVHNATSYYKLVENFVLFYLSQDPKIWGLRLLLILYAQSGLQVSIIAL